MGVSITCCKCGASFDERTLAGTWLNRRCPACSARISERDYDARARRIISRINETELDEAELGESESTDQLPESFATYDIQTTLDQLALARYYASEWFRLACAGRGSEAPDRGLFGLKPSYDSTTGSFILYPADEDRSPDLGLGTSAEYFVFDALLAEVNRKRSPLYGAFLAPSLEFPWLPSQKPKQWGAQQRGETDCIILARSCAVIVEVKRYNHHVKASGDFEHLRTRGEDTSFRSASEVLEQTENELAAFAERQSLYPRERIYRMVVFVEPLSFSCPTREFRNNTLISYLDQEGGAHFIPGLRKLVKSLDRITDKEQARNLGMTLLRKFGHTQKPHEGFIVKGDDPSYGQRLKSADALLDAIQKRIDTPSSPLFGGHLLRNLACEVELGKRGKQTKFKKTRISGLLLLRTHAVFIDAKAWHAHVNTHAPFATVYAGELRNGAKRVNDEIRHDWDLDAIGYTNRSGSLTLAKFVSRRMSELEQHRDRNRVYMMTAFINPVSFHSDGDDFKQRAFIGYWSRKGNNVLGALERLAKSVAPVMSQAELDALADEIAAIGSDS